MRPSAETTMLAVLAVVGLVLGGGVMVGAASVGGPTADVTQDPANYSATGSAELLNTTLAPDNTTRSLYVELDPSADTDGVVSPVNVTVESYDPSVSPANRTFTTVATVQLDGKDGVAVFETASANATREYRVVAKGESDTDPAAVSVGTVEEVAAGGGGGLLGGSGSGPETTTVIVGALVVIGALLVMRE